MDDFSQYFNELEKLKRHTAKGIEYWSARDLQGFFGYSSWERFDGVIKRASEACERSGQPVPNHFHRSVKMVEIGSGAGRERSEWLLTRYASYLVAMNGDPAKPEIAYSQTYFALQTRKQEQAKNLAQIEQRMELRERMKEANKSLQSAAHSAGVQKFGTFHNAGYQGLYGGLSQADIKELKGIGAKEQLLDRMGSAELASNYFRATQAEAKITRENVRGEDAAIRTHREVGREVRGTIERIGGVMPESLPAEPPIKALQKERKRGLLRGQKNNDDHQAG